MSFFTGRCSVHGGYMGADCPRCTTDYVNGLAEQAAIDAEPRSPLPPVRVCDGCGHETDGLDNGLCWRCRGELSA